MIYLQETRTLVATVAPGAVPPERELIALAGMRGTRLQGGEPVECVAVVYVGGPSEAVDQYPVLRRLGLQVRSIGDDGRETMLLEGDRVNLQGEQEAVIDPLYPILREATWPQLAVTPHRRLVPGAQQGPWVTYAWDAKESIQRLTYDDLGTHTVEEVETLALACLSRLRFEPQVMGPGIVALMGEYCSEAALLPDVMTSCARALRCELMLVAVPRGGRLMAVRAADFGLADRLMRWTHDQHASGGRRISRDPLLVDGGGVIVGLATASY